MPPIRLNVHGRVRTIEVGPDRPLMRAWFLEDAAPFGACRPAMVLAAAGLLRRAARAGA